MPHKILLASWSLRNLFRREGSPLRLLDYPRVAKEVYGFDAVEVNSRFFASLDAEYLDRLKASAAEAGVVLNSLSVDGTGDPSSLDEETRRASLERINPWFEVARRLGLEYFRVNTGGSDDPGSEQALARCIESFRELADLAEAYDVKLAIENHGGLSSNPANIVRIIEAVGSDRLGTLPDFGNFPTPKQPKELEALRRSLPPGVETDHEIRLWGLKLMAPYALGVHAKMSRFDEEGNEVTTDVPACVAVIREAGFDGYWGIEYVSKDDEASGLAKSLALLKRALG